MDGQHRRPCRPVHRGRRRADPAVAGARPGVARAAHPRLGDPRVVRGARREGPSPAPRVLDGSRIHRPGISWRPRRSSLARAAGAHGGDPRARPAGSVAARAGRRAPRPPGRPAGQLLLREGARRLAASERSDRTPAAGAPHRRGRVRDRRQPVVLGRAVACAPAVGSHRCARHSTLPGPWRAGADNGGPRAGPGRSRSRIQPGGARLAGEVCPQGQCANARADRSSSP